MIAGDDRDAGPERRHLPRPADTELGFGVHQVGLELADEPADPADAREGDADLRVAREGNAGEFGQRRRTAAVAIPPGGVGLRRLARGHDRTLPAAAQQAPDGKRGDDGNPVDLRRIGVGTEEHAHRRSGHLVPARCRRPVTGR